MKRYPEEFKREAVELLRTNGRPLAQIARELGVSAGSLRLWRKQAEIDAREREGLSSQERVLAEIELMVVGQRHAADAEVNE